MTYSAPVIRDQAEALRAMSPAEIFAIDSSLISDVRLGLAEAEVLLRKVTDESPPGLDGLLSHLVSAGGKRFRPGLVLVCAQFGTHQGPDVVKAAVVCELTHVACLYHDDVMDEAMRRRGVATVNSVWGDLTAVRAGDLLFAKAAELAADLGAEALRIQAETAHRLVVGQFMETIGPRPGDDPLRHYLDVVAGKTGSLIATASCLGAMLSGAEPAVVETLTRFGELIGVTFQLADDLLDIAGDTRLSGKSLGTDLRQGVPTLPTLHVRAAAGAGDERLVELIDGDLSDDAELNEAIKLLRAHPGMERAREEVRQSALTAKELLMGLPRIPAWTVLQTACDAVVQRNS